MSEESKSAYSRDAVTARVRRNASQAAFPALLVLVVGWFMFAPFEEPQGLAQTVVAAMVWTLRIGGIVLMLAAALCWTGAMIGFVLDAIASTGIAIALVFATLTSISQLDLTVLVFAVFAALYIRAAIALWRDYAAMRAGMSPADETVYAAEETVSARSSHEGFLGASLREDLPGAESTPDRGAPPAEPDPNTPEDPPPDGYLAGLAEEKKNKPERGA